MNNTTEKNIYTSICREMDQRKSTRTNQHKSVKLIIDSDSETEGTSSSSVKLKRKSARLSNKQKKPDFKLPSRDEIWKEIPILTEDIHSLKHVTPKKTVNNFTKIYNDYNFDDYEDTSDSISSAESSSEEGSESSIDNQEKKSHRIRNFYSRIKQAESSDEEQKAELFNTTKSCKLERNLNKNDNADSLEEHVLTINEEDDDDSVAAGKKLPKRKRYSFPESDDEETDTQS